MDRQPRQSSKKGKATSADIAKKDKEQIPAELNDMQGNHLKVRRSWFYKNFPLVLTFFISIFGGFPGFFTIYDRLTNNVDIKFNPIHYGSTLAHSFDSLRHGELTVPMFYCTGILTNNGRASLLPYMFSCYLTNKDGDTCYLAPFVIYENMKDSLKKMFPDFPDATNDLINAKMIRGPGEERGTFMFAILNMSLESFKLKFITCEGYFSCLDQAGKEYHCKIHFEHNKPVKIFTS